MENNIIYLSGGRQKSYFGGRQKSYLAAARRDKIIWRPPDNSSGGRQIIYLAAAR